ncbi:MAG: hypothetical protein HQ558_07585 [Candidatus Omnitrophica bacterium]|nr:hypothetical protein [Candidatus Omnitrophota bacterium]
MKNDLLNKIFSYYRKARMRVLPPIIIYQVGKVGSKTIEASLKNIKLRNAVYHAHFLSWDNMEAVEKELLAEPNAQPPRWLRRLRSLRRLIDENPGVRWKIITGVREPVIREISDVFQNLERDMPDLDKDDEEASLERIRRHVLKIFKDFNETTDYTCCWFDKELKDVFSVDVYASDFNKEAGYKIYSSDKGDILLIRLEDLSRCAREAFQEFLGIENFSLSKDNIGDKKWYSALYRWLLDSIIIPRDDLDRIYSSRYARRFYTEEEIAGFRKRWTRE